MRISAIELRPDGDGCTVTATVSHASDRADELLEFHFNGVDVSEVRADGSAFVPAGLLPAMALREDLEITAPVSPRLLGSAAEVGAIYADWVADYRHADVTAPVGAPAAENGDGDAAGLFFTCGVDSFYSLLSHVDPAPGLPAVRHLVFANGFDIALSTNQSGQLKKTIANIQAAADERDARLIVVDTNLRTFSDRYCPWHLYHGAALATIGHLLSPMLTTLYLASSEPYSTLVPWGTHPLLDHLWSSERLRFISDGTPAGRTDKVRRIAADPLALRTLRVCWNDDTSDYNCGRCEKCLRTMIALELAGGMRASTAFAVGLDVENVRRARLHRIDILRYWQSLVDELADRPDLAGLREAAQQAVEDNLTLVGGQFSS